MNNKTQIVYFSHGGGPLPILGDSSHQAMLDFMTGLPARLHKPAAILVISAHWEEKEATLTGAQYPPMLYDYHGFPPESYRIQYPAPGNPALAERIARLLQGSGIPARVDPARGYDHGMFIPLKMMYPQADIPCLQLSLIQGLDPATHLGIGRALQELAGENVLIIGSGFSFHNMRAFSWGGSDTPDPANDQFQDWLIETCCAELSGAERTQRLLEWSGAPHARYCHPREEHLMPLHACYGASDARAELIFNDKILGKRCVAFLWGAQGGD